jgi:hypothetical protein
MEEFFLTMQYRQEGLPAPNLLNLSNPNVLQ